MLFRSHIKLLWQEIFQINVAFPDLPTLLNQHKALFKEELGTVKGVKAKSYVNSQDQPKYFKPRPVAYALRQKVDGTERPISYASRSFCPAEKIMFGGRKFHLYGWEFRIYTDHKPLLGILQSNKPIPTMASPGIQR